MVSGIFYFKIKMGDMDNLVGALSDRRSEKGLLHCIKAIAFDADDTLWALQNHFEDVERQYCKLLSQYGGAQYISEALFRTETANMPELGYGCKAFVISLVETAVKVSNGTVPAGVIGQILSLGRSLLRVDAKPLDGVEQTLGWLRGLTDGRGCPRYRLALFTKGELLDQENKLRRSGLERYFDYVSVVSDKDTRSYMSLCKALCVAPSELLMVGNSFKSDIAPALEVGAYALYIPFHTIWAHEASEVFDHERLLHASEISDMRKILG